MASGSLKCFSCGQDVVFVDRVSLRQECEKCGSDVHVCRNCSFHDPKVYNECLETQSERVAEKDRSNRCEYFQPHSGAGGSEAQKKQALMSAAEALFKKKT